MCFKITKAGNTYDEYVKIETLFYETTSKSDKPITKISRVQNIELWERYERYCSHYNCIMLDIQSLHGIFCMLDSTQCLGLLLIFCMLDSTQCLGLLLIFCILDSTQSLGLLLIFCMLDSTQCLGLLLIFCILDSTQCLGFLIILIFTFSRNKTWKERKYGRSQEEKLLFHGTRKAYIDAICQQGFDWRIAGSSVGTLYGKGSYFALSSKYSTSYTDCKTMFVVRVLVGESGQGNKTLVKPPPLNPSKPLGRLYDTCVDNLTKPSMVVVFEQERAYPEYIVQYN